MQEQSVAGYFQPAWRRAEPTLHIRDPYKDEKMAVIRKELNECSAEHPMFYEDEVDIHLNPKIGATDRLVGSRNGSPHRDRTKSTTLHNGTGKVSYVGGSSKASSLFISQFTRSG